MKKQVNWIIVVLLTWFTVCLFFFVYVQAVFNDMKAVLLINEFHEGWIEFVLLLVASIVGIVWSILLYHDLKPKKKPVKYKIHLEY